MEIDKLIILTPTNQLPDNLRKTVYNTEKDVLVELFTKWRLDTQLIDCFQD